MNSEAQQAIASLQSSIQQFLAAPLSGEAYNSAKNYFTVVYTPLCRSATMTGEALVAAHNKLLSHYQSTVSSGDTNEDELNSQIRQLERLKRDIEQLMQEAKTMRPDLERRYMNACNTIAKKREKIQKFQSYNAQSAAIFSEFNACQREFSRGVAQVQNSKAWNSSTGTFDLGTLDMSWAKEINQRWDNREVENKEKQKKAEENSIKTGVQTVIEDTIFPLTQDAAMGLGEEWLTQNGDKIATGLYNTGTKYFGGTEVASGFYAGGKIVGSAGKAMPIIGAAIDFGSQVASGENVSDAGYKTVGHAVNGVIIGAGVTFLGLSGGWAIVATVGAGYIVNSVFDTVYDNKDNIVKGVGNAINSVSNWVGNAFS